jgi:arylsulfatase A-like enzyme
MTAARIGGALLLSLSLLLSCAAPAARPNILLIVLDTLRADRLGCYGNTAGLSPALDAFAAGSTRFARTRAAAPWTLPSHASLFTGLYAFEHGAHSYRVDVKPYGESEGEKKAVDNAFPLPESATTMAEVLASAGYATAGIVANQAYLGPEYGCTQGFADYQILPETADVLVDQALAWLDRRDDATAGPFFLFLNFMDTHSPYNVAPREGWEDLGTPADSAKLLNQLNDIVLPGAQPDPAQIDLLRRQYDLSVANLDEQMGRLFDALRTRGLFDEAVILLTSDHGEYLGEHQLIGHSKDVYEEAIAVPFLLKSPQQAAARVEERTISLVHAWALLAEHCSALGGDAIAHPFGEATVLAENYYSRIKDLRRPWSARFERCRVALYASDHKFIHSTDQRHELYELPLDPFEANNLAPSDVDLTRRLNLMLLDRLRPRFKSVADVAEIDPAANPRELSPEEQERLRSLGYF